MKFLSKNLLSAGKMAIDCLFPKHCLGCQKEGTHLCPGCSDSLPISQSINCFVCGRRSPHGHACDSCRRQSHLKLDGLLVASEWDNPLLKQLIYAYKYSFIQELAAPLSMIIGEYLKVNFLDIEPRQEMVLISVPLHPRRLAWRDFDQAELLAKTVSQISSVPFAEKVLIRHRYTLPQADIHDQAARRSNIKNAFSLAKNYSPNSNPLKNKIIILVDDVATTGATFQECVKVLKPLSPREIWGLVVARG